MKLNIIRTTSQFYVLMVIMLAFIISACSNDDNSGDGVPFAGFNVSTESAYSGDTIQFTDNTTGGNGSRTYLWNFGDSTSSTEVAPMHVYETAGLYVATLTVTDSKGKSNSYSKLLTIMKAIPPVGDIQFRWVADTYTGQFRCPSVTLSYDETRIYATSEDHYLHCYDAKTGVEQWKFDMRNASYGAVASGNSLCTPAVDTDGTVYVGDGNAGNGKLFAVNPDGTLKWFAFNDPENGFWNKGNAANPKINGTTPLVDDKYVYCGNGGSTGSFVAFDKTNGHRVGYVTAKGDPNSGPAGGHISDPVLTKQGICFLYNGTWGLYGFDMKGFKYDNSYNPCLWDGLYMQQTTAVGSTAADENGHWFATITNMSKTGNIVVCLDTDGNEVWRTSLKTAGVTDQGGIAIGLDGSVLVACKASGNYSGGIVALDPATGEQKWHYEVGENVSCAPAVAQNGDIVFLTEKGNLFIIDQTGQETFVKSDIAANLANGGFSVSSDWAAGQGKFWSAPIIASDGTIYAGFTNLQGDRSKSTVIALQSKYVTAPGASVWPMRGHDAQHTCTIK